jgi:O-antigen/teichoic acid export membrane protein
VFGALVAIASIFATLSFEFGILGGRRRSDALGYAFVALACLLTMTGATLALLALSAVLGMEPALPHWVLLSAVVSCFLAALTSIGINWAIRSERPGVAARGTFVSLSGRSASQAALGFLVGGLPGLVVGELLGRVAGWLTVERGIVLHGVRSILAKPHKVRKGFSARMDYPLYTTPGMALETALVWLPAPLFALFFDPTVGGYVALVQRLGSAPLTVANQSLGQLFHRRASQLVDTKPGRIVQFVVGLSVLTMPLTLAVGLVLWFWGEQLAVLVLGRQWSTAGFVALAFLPLYYLQFLSLMTNRLLLILGRMRLKLIASATHVLLISGGCAATASMGMSWQSAIIAVPAVLALSHFAFLLIAIAMLGRHRTEVRLPA